MRLLACLTVACCTGFVLAPAAPLSAQACLGYPTPAAQFSVNPGITFADGATTFGGTINANLPAPLGIEAGIGLTDYDDIDSNGIGFSGRVGYELETPQLSTCPFGGFSYQRVSEDAVTISALTVPIGFGVGKTLPAGEGYAFTVSGAPQLLYVRQNVDVEEVGDDSESDVEFGLGLGATLGTDRIYGGFTLTLSTVDGSDTIFGISMGFLLGN